MNKLKNVTSLKSLQKGTILIVALFIITLVEIVVFGLVSNHKTTIHHSKNYFASLEAIQIALGGEEWAKARLLQSFKDNKNMIEDLLPRTPIQGGFIEGEIADAQRTFNLNNLMDPNTFDGFNNMVTNLLSNQKMGNSTFFSSLIAEKFDASSTANGQLPFNSVTEIRTLKDMTSQLFIKILPYLSVLPETTALNINSAANYDLLSLSPKLTLSNADSIIKMRENMKGFSSIDAFVALEPLKNIEIDTNLITIQSKYFLSSITVHYYDIDLTLNSLLKVVKDNNRIKVNIEWRSFGTL
jgi:general secretion pathway protein K